MTTEDHRYHFLSLMRAGTIRWVTGLGFVHKLRRRWWTRGGGQMHDLGEVLMRSRRWLQIRWLLWISDVTTGIGTGSVPS